MQMGMRIGLCLFIGCLVTSLGYAAEEDCMDPTPWGCGHPNVQPNGSTCGTLGICTGVGNTWHCSEWFFETKGGAWGQNDLTSGQSPAGNGKRVTNTTFKVCTWANFCWEECAETQGGNHVCSGDYIPAIPFGGFDLDFGADCPNP